MAAEFYVTLNIFKHRYVLAISHLSFIYCKYKAQILRSLSNKDWNEISNSLYTKHAIIFMEEFAKKC